MSGLSADGTNIDTSVDLKRSSELARASHILDTVDLL